MRAALGASRGRVMRYLLAESLVLAGGSVAVGAAFAWVGIRLFRGVGSRYFPRMHEVGLGSTELWVMLALALASAAIFGLIPALHGTGGPVDQSLRASGRTTTGGIGVRRLRRLLVASQFAIATPLLIVAGLLLASLGELRRVDVGFDTSNVITAAIRLPAALYADDGRVRALWDNLTEQLGALPGVSGVAFADGRPVNGVGNINNFDLEDSPARPGQSQPATPWVAVTPEYFRVLGLSLIEGRPLDQRDNLPENLESVVVDRAWARRFFPTTSAVGKRFREGGCTTCPWTSVVGVVSDVKYVGLDQPDRGTVYSPLSLNSRARQLVVRTTIDAGSVLPDVRARIRQIEPGAPLSNVATIDDLVDQSLERPQSLSMLIAALAGIALALSVLGIYGVMSYYVQQHVKEIGIRMALGGKSTDVLRMVVGQGMRVVAAGVFVGLLAAIALARLAASLLFGVNAADPLTFSGVAALLIATALAACAMPAYRAVLVQPATVLRND
jgi:putative ABC transport system permease protein